MAHSTQKMMEEEEWQFRKKEDWLPSSPDCAPLDYGIWDYMARKACRDVSPTLEVLKNWVNMAWDSMEASFIKRCTAKFCACLEAVISVGGG